MAIIVLLGIATWSFAPGLGGDLIFDDYPNFLPWQQIGDINTWEKVLQFTFSGNSIPGRPLSLISFLADDQSWSPDPHSLKRTNLAIHLINSLLIFWLAIKLITLTTPACPPRNRILLALLASSIWTLHPLQVSNVSYIIQRMNLLSTMLESIGLLLFIHGRTQLLRSPHLAILTCSIGIGLFMPLAILAKENGLLLCAFALLVERFCFPPPLNPWYRAWKALFLWIPLLAFLAYCLKEYDFFTQKLAIRNFTSWERLLTQGPIICDYLEKLLLPRISGSTLFYENYPVSRSLLNPISTLPAWLLITALLVLAWRLRNKRKLIAFGIFFYFCGHLMESTLIPLELYFEHRNYLPQFGLWLALAGLINELRQPRLIKFVAVAAIVLLGLLSLMTRSNSSLWGNTDLQIAMWYKENTGSQRATQSYINLLLQRNDLKKVNEVFVDSLRQMPNNLGLLVSKRYIDCYLLDKPTRFDDLPEFARHADYDLSSLLMLERMRKYATENPAKEKPACQLASPTQIGRIYTSLLANPSFNTSSIHSRLNEYLSEIATQNGQLNDAMHYLDEAFKASYNPIYPYRQAVLLQTAGLDADAKPFIRKAEEALTPRYALLYPDLKVRIQALHTSLNHSSAKPPDS